jgi:hypothetical protein
VWNDLNAGWPSSDARDAERTRCSVTCDALSHVNARGLVLLGRKPPTVTPQYGQPGGAGLAVARRVDGCEDDVRLRRLRGFGETAFALDPERRPVRKRGFARSTRAESLGSDQATHVSPERRLNMPEKKLQGFGPRTEPEEPRALPGYSAPHTFPTLRGLRQANRFGRLRANRR